ncbi:MAG: response regulator [Patescibacteria group bacterium]|nr:response regulator [Patescibacteria group bacterium]
MAHKVLLVEDDPFLSSLLGNRLKKEGFDLSVTHSGNEAVKTLKEVKPELMLLDLILPGKSGFEVMEEMNTDPQAPKTPVIIISNLGQEADVARGKELGAVDYVVKARMTIDDMVDKVKGFFGGKK